MSLEFLNYNNTTKAKTMEPQSFIQVEEILRHMWEMNAEIFK